jgi:hypothetical protein
MAELQISGLTSGENLTIVKPQPIRGEFQSEFPLNQVDGEQCIKRLSSEIELN